MDPAVSASNPGKLIITKKQANASNKIRGGRVQQGNILHLTALLG
jgi:hypothetical protein